MEIKQLLISDLTRKTIGECVNKVMREIEIFKCSTPSEQLFFNIKLVIWELFSNIIQHENLKIVDVQIIEKTDFSSITVRISAKRSKGFDWLLFHGKEGPDATQEGGRGLFLIQQLCDFSFDDCGKVATAIFNMKEEDSCATDI